MAGGYFVDHKRGELQELKQLLRNVRVTRDLHKMREVVKRVLAYVTLGIDASSLFSEMVLASHVRDPVLKKSVYSFLTTYAERKQDLAVLAINALHKDSRDENSMIRGLALRSLCSLRLANIAEYVLAPIRAGLEDASAYVRKTAVLGVAKLFTRDPQAVRQSDLVDVLYSMLRDTDPLVVVNVVCALNEVLVDEGGVVVNDNIVKYLLGRVYEMNEWGQCLVLEVVAQHRFATEEEMFECLNLLEDRLQHSNAAVVLAAAKVFLHFTEGHPGVHREVYDRLRAPLLTLVGSGSQEMAYAVLSHVLVLVRREPAAFADEHKALYLRHNDTVWNKLLKLEVLELLATPATASELLAELGESATDVRPEIARRALRGIGRVASRVPAAVDEAIELLLSFTDMGVDYLTAEACLVLRDLLRVYPERYTEVVPAMQRSLPSIEETEGKQAVLWVMGEYGDSMRDAPYILEGMVDSFDDEPEAVRLELITAAVKLFFRRPPEMRAMLGRLLSAAVEDTAHVNVRDRALLYYRLLVYDVHEAARVVNGPKAAVAAMGGDDAEEQAALYREFNSLSVVYRKEAKQFVTGVELEEEEDDDSEDEDGGAPAPAPAQAPAAAEQYEEEEEEYSAQPPVEVDLMGFGDIAAPAAAATPQLRLRAKPTVDPKTFQAQWGRLGTAETLRMSLGGSAATAAPGLDKAVAPHNVATMASGTVKGVTKYYFFARSEGANALFLAECVINLRSGELVATVKAEDAAAAPAFAATLRRAVEGAL